MSAEQEPVVKAEEAVAEPVPAPAVAEAVAEPVAEAVAEPVKYEEAGVAVDAVEAAHAQPPIVSATVNHTNTRQRAPRDPGAPKRNMSAYLLYQNAMRDTFKQQVSGVFVN